MSKILLVLSLGLLLGSGAWGDAPRSITGTVKTGNLAIQLKDVLVTPKQGYVQLLWDAYPCREAIKRFAVDITVTAEALVAKVGLKMAPRAKKFKVVIVEFAERDGYDAPRWDKVKRLGGFMAEIRNGKVERIGSKSR